MQLPYDIKQIPNWSYSLLTQFEKCGWLTLNTRVQKTIKEARGTALIEGDEIHKAIEAYLKLGHPFPTGREYLLPHVERFRQIAVQPGVTTLVEHEMCLTPELEFTAWFSKDKAKPSWLRIKTDLAIMQEHCDYMLAVDFKTGKRFDAGVIDQLKLNAFGLFLQYPHINRIAISGIFLNPKLDVDPVSENIYREQMWEIWNSFQIRLQPLARAYQTGEWRKIPGWQCRGCPVVTCDLHPGQ